MKIEPRKTASLPKYAAVLASAVLLTGCGMDEPVATEGEAVTLPDSTLDLAGDEAVFPDLTETSAPETEPMLEGEALPYDGDDYCTTETTAVTKLQLVGVIDVNPDMLQRDDDPLMLDGDVAFAPDFLTDTDKDRLELLAAVYQSAFAEQGITVTKSGRKVSWFGAEFYEELKSSADKVQVIFFDGKATDSGDPGVTQREWLQGCLTEQYDWGGVLKPENPDAEYTRVIFVDINTETLPETVAEDAGL